jgi:hypothetical protein
MWRSNLTLLAALLACSSPSADRARDTAARRSRAEPDAQLRRQSQPQLAKYLAGCPLTPPNPPVARGVFDVYLGAPHVPSPPSDTAVRAIERRGARILHRYRVDVIRAEIDTALAHALVRGPHPLGKRVRQVADTAPLTIPVVLFYGRALTASDSVFLSELKGAPIKLPRDLRMRTRLFLDVHDSLIPRLQSAPGVLRTYVRGEGCGVWLDDPTSPGHSAPAGVPQN